MESEDNPGSGVHLRSSVVLSAVKQIRGDVEVMKKREELQRRIEETRRQLQSVSLDIKIDLW